MGKSHFRLYKETGPYYELIEEWDHDPLEPIREVWQKHKEGITEIVELGKNGPEWLVVGVCRAIKKAMGAK